jgi:hypothetical protein
MVFETSYSGTYTPENNHHEIPHPEFVHSSVHSEWAHCSAIWLVILLGISLQMDLDSNDVAALTGSRSVQQCYVDVNISQALGVGYGPVVIPAVNDL